jgi:hypothetical protein
MTGSMLRRSAVVLLSLVAGLVAGAASAGRPAATPIITIFSPANGAFTTDPTVTVTGRVTQVNLATATLRVNGTVVPMNPDGTFSHVVTLNPTLVFNPIETRLTSWVLRLDRRVVIAGDSVADGDLSPSGLALRLNDSGLDALEPVVTSLVDLDLATLVPAGTQVINEYCIVRVIVCIQSADAFVEGSPPPSIGSFSIDIDSQPNFAFGDILLNDLFIRVRVVKGSAGVVPFTCFVTVTADTTDVEGDFALEPMVGDPEFVDVTQVGPANVLFGGFDDATDCSGIFGGVLELFVNLLVGDIQTLMEPAFEAFLNAPDLVGNTPVAGAIEAALSEIHIAGPVGEGIGVRLEAPLFEVTEDADGITLGADARVLSEFGTGPGQCTPPFGTADLLASFHVDETFPSFGPLTPGGVPYDLGIAISTSAFNQLLKAQTECGLLQLDLSEVVFLGQTVQLTAGLIGVLIPEFRLHAASTPIVAHIQPTTAPVLTGEPGPGGEDARIAMGQLLVDLRNANNPNVSYLKVAVDFRAGLDFEFDSVTGSLTPVLAEVLPSAFQTGVLSSFFGTVTPEQVQAQLPLILSDALPLLADTLGTFPIPSFFGFQLQAVELGRNGQFLSIFANLAPAP